MKQIAGLLVIPDNQAEMFRLTLTGKQVLAKPDARRHESLMDRRASRRSSQKRQWNCEPGTREHRMNLSRHRMIPAGHLIHDAVYLQGLDYGRSSPSTQFASRPLVLAVRDPRLQRRVPERVPLPLVLQISGCLRFQQSSPNVGFRCRGSERYFVFIGSYPASQTPSGS